MNTRAFCTQQKQRHTATCLRSALGVLLACFMGSAGTCHPLAMPRAPPGVLPCLTSASRAARHLNKMLGCKDTGGPGHAGGKAERQRNGALRARLGGGEESGWGRRPPYKAIRKQDQERRQEPPKRHGSSVGSGHSDGGRGAWGTACRRGPLRAQEHTGRGACLGQGSQPGHHSRPHVQVRLRVL